MPVKPKPILMGISKRSIFFDIAPKGILCCRLKTRYPSLDNHPTNDFYQILSEGNITLLRWQPKRIVENKTDIWGEIVKEFNDYEELYVSEKNG